MLLNLKDRCTENGKAKKGREVFWKPLPSETLQFNADGSSRGSPGEAGIGGVMRNSNGKVMCIFSSYVGIRNANTAEGQAIRMAVNLCASNPMLAGKEIFISSDSKEAVAWVYSDDFGSPDNLDYIYDIRDKLNFLVKTTVIYNPRTSNAMADLLAKRASNHEGDVLEWNNYGDLFYPLVGLAYEDGLLCFMLFL
ncbi:hypothetical protein Ddye_027059 [Dipteronia dyeriana]|uniref:RNase H type-1 domain-containing protein n=1 Tax=Dipteronia dyeriana TaxID=168575 RepID=A0AAD9TNC3_9ROSI|nr:hypothetical protein Ddye_027059 [Dipteronia dyeriana]